MRFNLTTKKLLGGGLLLAVSMGPLVVGVLPVAAAIVVLGPVACFALYAFGCTGATARLKKIALVALSICFAVTVFDLVARVLLLYVFEDRPKVLFAHRLPALPEVSRFTPRLSFQGRTYGDLAAVSGRKDWREYRSVSFNTDAYGFRNDVATAESPPALIVLGDSFGVGDSTEQAETLSNLLAREHGLPTYNLSMDGASPWQEYVNLLDEDERLPLRPSTTVLWLFFTGNDLDDFYLPLYDKAQLPWHSRVRQLQDSVRDFRYRSPLRRLLLHGREPSPRADVATATLPDGRTMLFSRTYAQAATRTLAAVREHPHFASLQATVSALKRFADVKQLNLVIALVPTKEEVYSWLLNGQLPWSVPPAPSGFAQALDQLSRQQGIAFLDLKPALFAAARQSYEQSGALLWWTDDTHWNARGQRAAAAAIYEQLLSKPGPHRPQTADKLVNACADRTRPDRRLRARLTRALARRSQQVVLW